MERDIRGTKTYQEAEAYFRSVHAPGENAVTDGADLVVSASGEQAAFTGTIFDDLASPPRSAICFVDMSTGELRQLDGHDGNARMPKWAPDMGRLAFLCDEEKSGAFQLRLAGPDGAGIKKAPAIEGLAEYYHWSPDSKNIIVGVAGFGADLAGCQGGATTPANEESSAPDWAPNVDTGDASNLWRNLFVVDDAGEQVRQINRQGTNCWEACWLGPEKIAAIVSPSHSEGAWYTAQLVEIDLVTGDERLLYKSDDQIGVPAASPSGQHVAVIEAVCSDRLIVCGNVQLIDPATGKAQLLSLNDIDVTHLVWRDNEVLTFTGHRAFETVVGEVNVDTGAVTEIWASTDRTIGAWYPSICTIPSGGVAGIAESYATAPEICVFNEGQVKAICSLGTIATLRKDFSTATIEPVQWNGRDGLEIHGWLVRPAGDGPFPVVMDIHGGPVWVCRNRWQGRLRAAAILAERGFAIFFPNPRGSSTRGQEFARLVKGDMGGEDTYDFLTGIDALVARGIADPKKLGVTGISYGGFASCWLITQDARFAAALPISPVSNFYSQHHTSQIPFFDGLFLDDDPYTPNGRHFTRSPVMFARNVKTPTLQLTGALDQNTPPTQALEFHRALLENGVPSILVTYPKDGHGIRGFPSVIDHTARYVDWFERHMPPG